ncbi:MAG: 8-amino-7-oxononanoate synthase [Planctomycetota bacterium]|jgi:8-amino-7-oxononanoate synthase
MNPAAHFAGELASLSAQGLLRTLRPLPATGGTFLWQGRQITNFSSNDYLNLASDARLKAASIAAIKAHGCGATASRLMSGHLELHEEIERALSRLTGQEAALVFGSGFLTNLGVLTALAGRQDTIFADRLNHASLVDGARLSRARLVRYAHNDPSRLESLLSKHKGPGRKLIVTDSLFSMDGDLAPLADLAELAERYGALLIVDEAHAMGVLGEGGGGLCRGAGARVRPDVVIGTLSKALGGYGGFATCSEQLRTVLVNRARSFIYSTGLPPACLGSARAALAILEESPGLGASLLERAAHFRDLLTDAGFGVPAARSQIVPLLVGENRRALAFSQALFERGVLATAVRPPTVPKGTARLRISLTLAHGAEVMEAAAAAFSSSARQVGML